MKHLTQFALIIVLVLAAVFALPSQVYAQGPDDGKVVFGGIYQLNSGETLNGSLAIFGGAATLEEGSKVNGSIVISGGTLKILGEVNGDVTTVGGALTIGNTAHLHGNIYTVGGSLDRSPEARIDGNTISGAPNNFDFRVPTLGRGFFNPFGNINLSPVANGFTRIISSVFQALAMAVLALLMAMFLLKPTERVVGAINAQPVMSGAFGLLTLIVAPALLILLAITIILIPVSLLGIVLLALAAVFGWIALGLELGRRLAAMLKVTWTAPIEAGVGTLILSLVVSLLGVIPCIGWLAGPILGVIGLGAVILTRFGTRVYIGNTPAPVGAEVYPSRPVVVPPTAVRTQPAPEPVRPTSVTPENPAAPGNAAVYDAPSTPAPRPEPPAAEDETDRPSDESIPPAL